MLDCRLYFVSSLAIITSITISPPSPITTLTNLTDGVFSNEQEEKDIISELKVLMHVEAHPNIVCLLGASVNNGRRENIITSYFSLMSVKDNV